MAECRYCRCTDANACMTNARIAELEKALSSLVDAKALAGVRGLVAGWNGEGRSDGPFERHPPRLGATLKTTCGAVYELDEALTEARAALASHPSEKSEGGK